MDNVTIYTSVTPGYDAIREDVLHVPPSDIFKKSVMNAKIIKVLSHQYVRSKISVWHDGHIYVKPGFNPIELLEDYDMVLMRHPQRNCIYQEQEPAKVRISTDIEGCNKIDEQIQYYLNMEFPKEYGLWCGGFIIRKNNRVVEEFNNAWWAEICRFSYRDQLSLPIALSKFPYIKLKTMNDHLYKNKYFIKKPHIRGVHGANKN